jgi:Cu2+-exporting ATPase
MASSGREAGAGSCAHCGLDLPADIRAAAFGPRFCCPGCATAWEVIHGLGLESYYQGSDRRATPVVPTGRRYDEYDHSAFRRLYVRELEAGLAEVDLYVEGVHCASCVWLVERVPMAVPGAVSAELNVPRALARIRWDPRTAALSEIARFLDRLGYPSHPFRGVRAETRRRVEDRAMIVRIGVAGAIAVNVMTVALALYAGWFGTMEGAYVHYFRWVSLLLTVPAILWPGRVFFTSAWAALRVGRLHMDVPIALALGAGFGRGAFNTVTDSGPIYFDGVVTLIFLLLVGRFLQQRAQRAAADSAELLHGLTPSSARLVEGDRVREVPIEGVARGAILEVQPGETIPSDGIINAGATTVDRSLLTGESTPIGVAAGETVYAGTRNTGAPIRVRVTEAGEATRLGRMLRDLEAGLNRRAPVVQTADRLAGAFVGAVLVLAVITWLWWRVRDPAVALDNAIALLIVTCPCALALATPLTMTVAIGRAAKAGILIRGGDALEVLSRPSVVLLDKTGTITEGRFELLDWRGDDRVRSAVKGIEAHANHPIARALAAAWPEVEPEPADRVHQWLAKGIEGWVGADHFIVGSPAFVSGRAADPERLAAGLSPELSAVLVARNGVVAAAAGLGDPIRADSAAAIDTLRRRGWQVGILSGDEPRVVAAAATTLGLGRERARGGATPEDKVAAVEAALVHGPVVMVGDGVNDAPAIGRATVGIGVRGGAEASLAAADVFLARPGLTPLVALINGARRTLAVIRRNIAVSIGYNLIGAGLAVTGLISPLIAAIMMPVSSVTVIVLSWRSRTFERTS